MAVSFTIISNITVTTSVPLNEKEKDLFLGHPWTGSKCLNCVDIGKLLPNYKTV